MSRQYYSVYDDKLYIGNDCVFPQDWTAADLMVKHRSRPHNPHIASVFFRAGYIEAWGRGIEKICNACKTHGNPLPEYDVRSSEIMVLFKGLENEPQYGAVNGAVNDVEREILAYMKSNAKTTTGELVEVTRRSRRTIQRGIKKLIDAGAIERVGSDKTDHWELIE